MFYGARLAGLPKQVVVDRAAENYCGAAAGYALKSGKAGNALSDASRMEQPGRQTAASAQNAV